MSATEALGDPAPVPPVAPPPPSPPLLSVEGLTKRYRKFVALSDLSSSISAGEIVGLLGPNGAGKTTTLRCIAGIIRPTSGRVRPCT